MRQSTNHLLMIEPSVFYANPQTMDTNAYQVPEGDDPKDVTLAGALKEMRDFRDMLVANGVMVTTALGHPDCPDMVFPNWASTYEGSELIIYPMLNENRQAERTPEIIGMLKSFYPNYVDWSPMEKEGMILESTASIVADHVNRRAYSGLSKRTSPEMVERWAAHTGYDVMMFDTHCHAGIPVYHTDFLMYVGTDMIGICSPCITDDDVRSTVLSRMRETHKVVEFTMEQLQANCGNALEVIGANGEKMLTMSKAAFEALSNDQVNSIRDHYNTLICPDLSTLEQYGGGSARCMLMELF